MLYRMPRVVSDQRAAFDSNDLFRRLSSETEIKYTGYRDSAEEERRQRFSTGCQTGRIEIAFVNSGTNFMLQCFPSNIGNTQGVIPPKEYVNFDREPGKVHLLAPFILNGVCVCLKGWISLHGLDGRGFIEFDEERAQTETSRLASTSGQHTDKLTASKPQSHKHPSTNENPSQIDKRPRLH